jgi:hypothetical protein
MIFTRGIIWKFARRAKLRKKYRGGRRRFRRIRRRILRVPFRKGKAVAGSPTATSYFFAFFAFLTVFFTAFFAFLAIRFTSFHGFPEVALERRNWMRYELS